MKYQNPIVHGFYPDPGVCRVGTMAAETAPHPQPEGPVELSLVTNRRHYVSGLAQPDGSVRELGRHGLRYLSTQVAGGDVGVVLGMFASAQGKPSATTAALDGCDYAGTF